MSKKSQEIRIACQLSKRQREVLELLASGETTLGIAWRLKISDKTVEWHRIQLMRSTGLFCYADLTKLAIRLGLTEIDV